MPATPDEAPANPSPERAAIAALTRALTAQDLGPLLAESKRAVRDAVHRDPIDALVVTTSEGEKVFTLAGADYGYRAMVETMNEYFGSCTNHGECEAACPKSISLAFIAMMHKDYRKAKVKNRKLLSQI